MRLGRRVHGRADTLNDGADWPVAISEGSGLLETALRPLFSGTPPEQYRSEREFGFSGAPHLVAVLRAVEVFSFAPFACDHRFGLLAQTAHVRASWSWRAKLVILARNLQSCQLSYSEAILKRINT